MGPEFSERQFEFAFNNEFFNSYRLQLVEPPYFPTLTKEAYLGYDVRYDFQNGFKAISLMLQIKTSHFVTRRSKNKARIFDCYHGAYFRFPVMRRYISKQHQVMLKLAERGENIFYCAPLFHTLIDLHSFIVRSVIIQNSRLFDPMDMGNLPDDNQHHVSYDPTGRFAFFHSENKRKIGISSWEKMISTSKSKVINEEFLVGLKNKLTEIFKEEYREFIKLPEKYSDMSILYQINYLLRAFVDITWFLIPSRY